MSAHSGAPNAFCATCLSQGRQMFTLPLLQIKPVSMFYKDLTLTENDEICWECKHFVTKMVNFKDRALKAQSILAAMLNKQPTTLQSLSKLTISNHIYLEITSPPQRTEPTAQNLDPLLIERIKSEPDSDHVAPSEWNMDIELESGNDGKNTFEVCDRSKPPKNTVEVCKNNMPPERLSEIKSEPVPERQENAGILETMLKRDVSVRNESAGVWGGVGFADATLMSLLNRKHVSYPPPINVPQRKLPMMEVPTLRILPKNPTPEIDVEKHAQGETSEKRASDPSGPCFTEERLTEEERERWWGRKKENEFYAKSIEVFKCEKCVEPFYTRRTFLGHEKMHTEMYGKLSCDICELRFHTEQALATHKDRHYRLLKCTRCAHAWDTHNSMRRHCEAAHAIPVTLWNCDICSREFTRYGKYLNHIRGHGCEECPQCGKKIFDNRMKYHMLTHKDIDRLFKCTECDKSFKDKQSLTTHVNRVHSSKDEVMYCTQCNKKFKNAYSYNHHMKYAGEHVSSEQLTHLCTECSRAFPTGTALRRHVESVHSDERRHECPVCHMMFKSSTNRTRHWRLAHDNYVAPRDKMCDHCGKAFKSKNMLADHMNTHTGARPFVCTLCGADFGHKSALYLHGRYKHKIPKKPRRVTFKKVKAETEGKTGDGNS